MAASRGAQTRLLDGLVLVGAFALAAAAATATSRAAGPTFDETTYVAEGLSVFRSGSHAGLLRLGTMPLPVDVATAPLYLAERLGGAALDPREDLGLLLPLARAGALPFLALLLANGMRLARRIGGDAAGRLAVLLLAAEPAILAHASLATTDVAVTALLLGQLDAFLAGRGAPLGRRVLLPGLWAAGALAAKASAVAFGPLLLLAAELHRLHGEGRLASRRDAFAALRPFARDLAAVAGVALLGALLYCGSDFRPEKSFVAWAARVDGPAGPALRAAASGLRVFPNALEGIVRQLKHNVLGHGVYLLGSSWRRAVPWYFPVALVLKLTPGVLLGLAALLAFRRRALANPAGLAALALLAFSFAFRVQIGIRLVLPLVALLLVALAAGGAAAARAAGRRGPAVAALLLLVPVGAAAASARALPDTLLYTSPLGGGTERGYRALSDSNYDWGQGLPALRDLCRARRLGRIDVWYFGTDPSVERPPFRRVDLLRPARGSLAEVAGSLEGDLLAVGATYAFGAYVPAPIPPWLAELRARPPDVRVSTFLVWDLSAERRRAARAAR